MLHTQCAGASINRERITSKKNFPSLVSLSNTLQLAGEKTTTQSSLALARLFETREQRRNMRQAVVQPDFAPNNVKFPRNWKSGTNKHLSE